MFYWALYTALFVFPSAPPSLHLFRSKDRPSLLSQFRRHSSGPRPKKNITSERWRCVCVRECVFGCAQDFRGILPVLPFMSSFVAGALPKTRPHERNIVSAFRRRLWSSALRPGYYYLISGYGRYPAAPNDGEGMLVAAHPQVAAHK